jgi:ribA/ribD-fused uncharacterized protein
MPATRGKKTRDEEPVLDKDDYVFFWKTSHVNGWGSQWYPAPFTATIEIDEGKPEQVVFPTSEHWMMVQKALLFGCVHSSYSAHHIKFQRGAFLSDKEIARKVLSVEETTSDRMRYVKGLGRKVKNFDETKWKTNRVRIVLEGNKLKFGQNEELRQKLIQTEEKTIVEASPRDKIWGIGMGETKAISSGESKWGLNLLGKALMDTRKALR